MNGTLLQLATGERQVVMSGHGREAVAYDMSFNFHLKVTYFLSDAAQRVLHKFIQKLLKCVQNEFFFAFSG